VVLAQAPRPSRLQPSCPRQRASSRSVLEPASHRYITAQPKCDVRTISAYLEACIDAPSLAFCLVACFRLEHGFLQVQTLPYFVKRLKLGTMLRSALFLTSLARLWRRLAGRDTRARGAAGARTGPTADSASQGRSLRLCWSTQFRIRMATKLSLAEDCDVSCSSVNRRSFSRPDPAGQSMMLVTRKSQLQPTSCIPCCGRAVLYLCVLSCCDIQLCAWHPIVSLTFCLLLAVLYISFCCCVLSSIRL